jgi:hypothetical protein
LFVFALEREVVFALAFGGFAELASVFAEGQAFQIIGRR